MYKRGDKKAQVTVFVVVGLIIIVLAGISYYYSENLIEKLRESEIFETTTLPLEVKGVEGLVNICIDKISRFGLEIIGQQGGYIALPEPKLVTPINPFSNVLDIFPGSNIGVVYWIVQGANGLMETLMPPRQLMELELEKYIDANLDNCVDFSNLDFNILSGDVRSDVKVLNEEVRINLEYPLEIDFEDKIFRLRDFNGAVKTPLGELYETAIEITNKENENFFLEERTIDFINVYDEIPYSGVDFECSPRRWKREDIINDLKGILDVNINSFRVKDTKDSEVEDKYRLLELIDQADDVNVNFEYSQNWPLLIDITPDDNIVQGDSFNRGVFGKFLTQFFCLNSYNVIYDLKYPVLVTLEKDDYTFQFATQVIVDNNQARENKLEIDQSYDTNPIICQNPLTNIKVFALGINPDNSLIDLKDAKVSYKCSTTICKIGETRQFNDATFLESKFPQCINGQLIVEKEGYAISQTELSTNQESTISVLMKPIYEKTFEVRVIENNVPRKPFKDEQIIINFRNQEDNHYETISYPGANIVKLIDGNYEIEAHTIFETENGIFIQGKELETCVDSPRDGVLGLIGLTEKKCDKVSIEGLEINQVFTGGAKFSWNAYKEDLSEDNELILYINGFGIPSNVDELNNVLTKIETINVLEPEFRK